MQRRTSTPPEFYINERFSTMSCPDNTIQNTVRGSYLPESLHRIPLELKKEYPGIPCSTNPHGFLGVKGKDGTFVATHRGRKSRSKPLSQHHVATLRTKEDAACIAHFAKVHNINSVGQLRSMLPLEEIPTFAKQDFFNERLSMPYRITVKHSKYETIIGGPDEETSLGFWENRSNAILVAKIAQRLNMKSRKEIQDYFATLDRIPDNLKNSSVDSFEEDDEVVRLDAVEVVHADQDKNESVEQDQASQSDLSLRFQIFEECRAWLTDAEKEQKRSELLGLI
jgi:hypothetical protein